jgi:hypothetical protein
MAVVHFRLEPEGRKMSPPIPLPGLPLTVVETAASRIESSPGTLAEVDLLFAISLCREARVWHRKAMDAFRAWLAKGVMGRTLVEGFGPVLEDLRSYLTKFEGMREGLKTGAAPEGLSALLAEFAVEFDGFVDEVSAHYRAVKAAVDLASAPPGPVDQDRARRNREAFAAGRTRPLTAED